jgi:hypothetical protein
MVWPAGVNQKLDVVEEEAAVMYSVMICDSLGRTGKRTDRRGGVTFEPQFTRLHGRVYDLNLTQAF